MSTYKFRNEHLAVDDNKIHFLRNKYAYDNVDFKSINEIVFKKGRSINNWVLLLVIGVVLFISGIIFSKNLFLIMFGDESTTIYIESIFTSVVLIIIGFILVIKAMKTEKIIEINFQNKTKKFAVKSFEKTNQLDDLLYFLSTNSTLVKEI